MTVRKFIIALVSICALAAGTTVAVGGAAEPTPGPRAFSLSSGALKQLAGEMNVLRNADLNLGQVTDTEDLAGTPVVRDDVIAVVDLRKLAAHPGALVAPTRDGTGLCVTAPARMTCGNTETLQEQGVAPAVVANSEAIHLIGLATDSVQSVEVVYPNGRTQTIEVTDNVIDVKLDSFPESVRWEGPRGPEALPVPRPAEAP